MRKVGGDRLNLEGDFRDGNPYMIEHINMLEGILKGAPLNEGENVALSTACAIIGRISAYTGHVIRMSDILENEKSPYYNMVCKRT